MEGASGVTIAPPRKYNDKIPIVIAFKLPIDEPSVADPPPAVPAPPPAAAEAAALVEMAAAAAPARGDGKPARRRPQYLGLNTFCLNLCALQLL